MSFDNLADLPEYDDHELVSFITDQKTGLKAFIAIHNTNLGPATGGTRYWHYASNEEALRDALRLSRAMTYKCALAGVAYGGGKAVIIGNHKTLKDEELLKAYAQRINLFKGNFLTGEDVGVDAEDVDKLAEYSPYLIGHREAAGDPSPWASLGVVSAMSAALKEVFGSDDMHGRTIAIRGLGKVGLGVAELVSGKGGKIIAADVNERAVQAAADKIKNITIVSPEEIYKQNVDVYSPNALGSEISENTINEFRCRIICGGANNQLKSDHYGSILQRLGILYIPDYVANAGGLINVVSELNKGGYVKDQVREKVLGIRETVGKIISLSKEEKKPTNEVADELARKIFSTPAPGVPARAPVARGGASQ